MKALVFLEHGASSTGGDELVRGSLGVLAKAGREDGKLIGKRPALADSVYVDVGWRSEQRIALFRTGSFDPATNGGSAEIVGAPVELEDFSTRAVMLDQAHEEQSGPSIEDADVIVAGGRGLGTPEGFGLCEDLANALGGAVASTRAVVDAGYVACNSDLGVVGDLHEVVPRLTELLRRRGS